MAAGVVQAVYYCGRRCQAADWKGGGHKRACRRFRLDMAQRGEMVALCTQAFDWAAATMAPGLSR